MSVHRLWRNVSRALAGYPSPVTGDEAKYQVEVEGRTFRESFDKEGKIWRPQFFVGDEKSWMDFKDALAASELDGEGGGQMAEAPHV